MFVYTETTIHYTVYYSHSKICHSCRKLLSDIYLSLSIYMKVIMDCYCYKYSLNYQMMQHEIIEWSSNVASANNDIIPVVRQLNKGS